MKLLVSGGRDYTNSHAIDEILNWIDRTYGPITQIISGGARGVDIRALNWAAQRQISCRCFKAEWTLYGRGAGAERNSRMLHHANPDVIVLFPGGSGTLDMFHRATLRQRCADSELRIINLMNPDSITDRLKQGA